MNNTLVFFIPGIMGSTLRLKKHGKSEDSYEEIWGSDIHTNLHTLTRRSGKLKSPDVIAGDVITEIKVRIGLNKVISDNFLLKPLGLYHIDRKVNIYGKLLEFCTSPDGLALIRGTNFFPFAYDWRLCNQENANKFALFIESILNSKGYESYRIKIIAHSMGGIIARLMLLDTGYQSITDRTDLLFQIASPIKGSAKAFYTLRKKPNFHFIFERLVQRCYKKDPTIFKLLMEVLANWDSLYQLLPHKDVITAINPTRNSQHPAVDCDIWVDNLKDRVNKATEVHDKLRYTLKTKVRSVYSMKHATPIIYYIDEYGHDIIEYDCEGKDVVQGYGDGTVICSSAYAYTDEDSCICFDSDVNTEHLELCGNIGLFSNMKEVFASV